MMKPTSRYWANATSWIVNAEDEPTPMPSYIYILSEAIASMVVVDGKLTSPLDTM
jgi:hypothetical protein